MAYPTMREMLRVLGDVEAERHRQHGRFGVQNLTDGTGGARSAGVAGKARRDCDRAAVDGSLSWRHVLVEEVAEAMAETDTASLRAELVQVAAVAVAWLEAL